MNKQKVIIIGAGYSIKEGIDTNLWDKIKDQDIYSCNYAYLTMPYLPKREIWVDIDFWKNNNIRLVKLMEQDIEIVTRKHPIWAEWHDRLIIYQSTRERQYYYGRDAIKQNLIYRGSGGFSGMFALSLAIAEGYQEIYLLGYDAGSPSINIKETHYYQDELDVISSGAGRPEVYLNSKTNTPMKHVSDYEVYLQTQDVKIWNVSMISNIKCFDKISYNDFYERIKQ